MIPPRRHDRLRRRSAAPLAAAGLLALAGAACTTSAPERIGASSIDATVGPLNDGGGLRLREWRIADRPDLLASGLDAYAIGLALPPDDGERLGRNGMRLVKVPVDAVDALLGDLGGATVDRDGWHGQAYEWREIAGVPVDPAGSAIAFDGTVRRLAGGRLRLLLRGWTMPMEDGPRYYIELVPVHDPGRASRLDQILGNTGFRGERFDELGATLEMEPGFAYVLAVAEPGAGDAGGGLGPDVFVPATVGELLLRSESAPPQCSVLVLIPSVPGVGPDDASAAVPGTGTEGRS